MNMKSRMAALLLALGGLALSPFALANEIAIYDQPNTTSKVVGKVDLSAGVIPIYSPTNSDWMKVGDPRNGNVGWIKTSDLNKQMGASGSATITQKIINDGKGEHAYQIIQYGQPQSVTGLRPVSPEEAKRMQMQQQDMQRQLQETIQNTVNRMNDFTQKLIYQMNGGIALPIDTKPATPPADKSK